MDDAVPIFAIFIPIIALIGSFIMVVYLRRFQNAERMAMIEKGVSPELFNVHRASSSFAALRAALLMIGGGVGLLLGYVLDRYFWIPAPLPYFAMLLICGGLGLGVAYYMEENKRKKEQAR